MAVHKFNPSIGKQRPSCSLVYAACAKPRSHSETLSPTRNLTCPFSPLLLLVPDIVLVSLGIFNLIFFIDGVTHPFSYPVLMFLLLNAAIVNALTHEPWYPSLMGFILKSFGGLGED